MSILARACVTWSTGCRFVRSIFVASLEESQTRHTKHTEKLFEMIIQLLEGPQSKL